MVAACPQDSDARITGENAVQRDILPPQRDDGPLPYPFILKYRLIAEGVQADLPDGDSRLSVLLHNLGTEQKGVLIEPVQTLTVGGIRAKQDRFAYPHLVDGVRHTALFDVMLPATGFKRSRPPGVSSLQRQILPAEADAADDIAYHTDHGKNAEFPDKCRCSVQN